MAKYSHVYVWFIAIASLIGLSFTIFVIVVL